MPKVAQCTLQLTFIHYDYSCLISILVLFHISQNDISKTKMRSCVSQLETFLRWLSGVLRRRWKFLICSTRTFKLWFELVSPVQSYNNDIAGSASWTSGSYRRDQLSSQVLFCTYTYCETFVSPFHLGSFPACLREGLEQFMRLTWDHLVTTNTVISDYITRWVQKS